jgi:DNA-binding MarR family transcriptional regulator
VPRLQQAGYVDRCDDPADRRNQLAVLTAQGSRLLEGAAPGHVEAVRRAVFDALTPQQVRQFAEIGEAINAALQRVDAAQDDQEVLPWRRR